MRLRRQPLWLLLICITLVSLEGFAVCQQKRKRPQRSKPASTSSSPTPTSSKTLTRSRAAELIKIHPGFKTMTDSVIPVGTFWYVSGAAMDNLLKNNIRPLVENGIVTYRKTGRTDSVWYHEYIVEITPAGQAEASTWTKGSETEWVLEYQGPSGIPSPNVTLFHIPVAQRQLIEVTGIALDSGGTTARVEFTWKWVPTTHGKSLPNKVPSDEDRGGFVQCRLYDDGWRPVGQIFL